MDKVPMTVRGHALLTAELKDLKGNQRPAIIEAIAEARAHGDLSENAEYQYAKEQQSFIEGRIDELEAVLSRADIIDPAKLSGDKVMFGATLTLADDDDKKVAYQIVGEHESDIKSGKLAIAAPLARALIGKKPGDVVEVATPKGAQSYEVLKIEYK
ncbi:MAG: transcription elongation factor GreA [Rhodospirillales bacterium]|nr:transcription elongation factor GreA [Alphaproteobacteria bacterium]MCB9986064.1 transcription elongation factor GreA [Rhodospirillales bacterium]USO08635.1 MAG: transcription elongation factor GreA [Rhodospirillales bacterium]